MLDMRDSEVHVVYGYTKILGQGAQRYMYSPFPFCINSWVYTSYIYISPLITTLMKIQDELYGLAYSSFSVEFLLPALRKVCPNVSKPVESCYQLSAVLIPAHIHACTAHSHWYMFMHFVNMYVL